MPEAPDQTDSMFPKLDDAQMARLAAWGQQGDADAGAILYDQGDSLHGVFVVLEGSLEVTGVSRDESVVRVLDARDVHGRGESTLRKAQSGPMPYARGEPAS